MPRYQATHSTDELLGKLEGRTCFGTGRRPQDSSVNFIPGVIRRCTCER